RPRRADATHRGRRLALGNGRPRAPPGRPGARPPHRLIGTCPGDSPLDMSALATSRSRTPVNAYVRQKSAWPKRTGPGGCPPDMSCSAQVEDVDDAPVGLDADLPHQLDAARDVGGREIRVERGAIAPVGDERRVAV